MTAGTGTAGTAKKLPYPNPTSPYQYAADLIAYAGWPSTPANQQFLTAWVSQESPTFPGYNGLGTTLSVNGSKPIQPGVNVSNNAENQAAAAAGVQYYNSLKDGLQAALDMFNGTGPQTTALAPQLSTALASGTATHQDLVNALSQAGGGWAADAQNVANMIGAKTTNGVTPQSASATNPNTGSAPPGLAWLVAYGNAMKFPSGLSLLNPTADISPLLVRFGTVAIGLGITAFGLTMMFGPALVQFVMGSTGLGGLIKVATEREGGE